MPTLSLDDGDLWYDTAGDGPPIVFVHGGWQSSDAWAPQVERFAPEYRVVTLDVRGHGDTVASGTRQYSIELFADDLEALLDHLGIERPILCGLSLGAMVVQEYLSRHPDRAAGAVIAGPVRSMPPIDLPAGTKRLLTPVPAVASSLALLGPSATFRTMLASIRASTGRPWLADDPAVRSRAIDAVGDVSREEYLGIFRALYEYVAPDLAGVETPTVVVYGEHEAPLVKRQGRQLAAAVQRGSVTEIPDAAHLVNEDNPEAFNAAVAQFLAEIRNAGAIAEGVPGR
ncbi:MAG: alpha/beta fold hydrolase [Haloarculaceae archaeon]